MWHRKPPSRSGRPVNPVLVVALVVGRLLVAVVVWLGLVALVGRLVVVELVAPLASLVVGRLVVGSLERVGRLVPLALVVGRVLVAVVVVVPLEPAPLVVVCVVDLVAVVASLVLALVVALVASLAGVALVVWLVVVVAASLKVSIRRTRLASVGRVGPGGEPLESGLFTRNLPHRDSPPGPYRDRSGLSA